MQRRISLAELIDADVPLRPDEAVAIMRDVCRQYAAGVLRGIPNATVIRLTPDGQIVVEGPVSRDQSPVPAAAALLGELLPGYDTATGFKVPGGLRLVLARATRSIDLPPFAGVGEFCAALERFAAPDLGAIVRGLFHAWESRQAVLAGPHHASELTISDIRRARRATGLSLEDVAQAAAVPASKLRELEWGYVRSWRADDEGRDQLRRYARAAGLDEDLVVSIAWPLMTEGVVEPMAEPPQSEPTWALVPAEPRGVVPLRQSQPATKRSRFVVRPWILAVASTILLVLGLAAARFERPVARRPVEEPRTAQLLSEPTQPPAARPVAATVAAAPLLDDDPAAATPARSVAGDARRASFVRPAAAPRSRAQKGTLRPAPRRHSFFKRELFRIVIR